MTQECEPLGLCRRGVFATTEWIAMTVFIYTQAHVVYFPTAVYIMNKALDLLHFDIFVGSLWSILGDEVRLLIGSNPPEVPRMDES